MKFLLAFTLGLFYVFPAFTAPAIGQQAPQQQQANQPQTAQSTATVRPPVDSDTARRHPKRR